MMAGFEYTPGRPADLRPVSRDLPLVADAMTRMAAALTPCPPVPIQPATTRWGRLLDPAFVVGAHGVSVLAMILWLRVSC
jgi:hypothetical protein